jgi:hypothetical protein
MAEDPGDLVEDREGTGGRRVWRSAARSWSVEEESRGL